MRLCRRTLLCLVVGVIAFGTAGWGLRPRPNWRIVACEPGCQPRVIDDESSKKTVDQVWVYFDSTDTESETPGHVYHFDVRFGEILKRVPVPMNVTPMIRSDGKLLSYSVSFEVPGTKATTRIGLVDPDGAASQTREFSGDWNVSKDGMRIWRRRELRSGLQVEFREAGGDWNLRRVLFGYRYNSFEYEWLDNEFKYAAPYEVSGDARRLVLSTALRRDAEPPYGIELWDLDGGRCIQAVALPPTPSLPLKEQGATRFDFDNGVVRFSWNDGANANHRSRWVWNLKSNRLERDSEDPSREFHGLDDHRYIVDRTKEAGGREFWLAYDHCKPPVTKFAIRQDRSKPVGWRDYSFKVPDREGKSVFVPHMHLVPGRSELVADCPEPPFISILPIAAHRFAPSSWKGTPAEWHYRWHDWDHDAWRDVGCPLNSRTLLVRSDAVVVSSRNEDETSTITCWPLPPRDPKPPALAIAALCMAGTWWVCAWRYGRRMRLAKAGAA